MKKKVLVIAIIAAIALIAIAGFTIAYFTDADENVNVITMGNVKIKLDEAKVSYDEQTYEFTAGNERVKANNYESVYPGAVLPKDPTVTNIGTMDAYVRVRVAFPVKDDAMKSYIDVGSLFAISGDGYVFGNLDSYKLDALFEGYDASKWTVEQTVYAMPALTGGDTVLELVFTYNEKLAPEDAVTLFTAVNIDGAIESPIDVTMDITAEAVQCAAFDSAAAAFAATFDAE